MRNSIIVIDDEYDFLETIKRGLITSGFINVRIENDPLKAASAIKRGELFDVALLDITMPGMNGTELLEIIKNNSPHTECIMVTAVNEVKVAVDCLKKGAYDYLTKPITREDLVLSINHALERKRLLDIVNLSKMKKLPGLINPKAFESIITQSSKIFKILKEAELHAASNVPVFIDGESGTGKELLAKAIHATSPRSKFPFTPINMASLTSSLFDAEFFGHTKGAFTGAEKDRAGYLEYTNHGTLFMDEIGSLPIELQGKLLRVFQEGEYIKLGTSSPQKADIRFIAATNTNLERLMANGKFRKDLYYRLKGAWLHLPPLRKRKGDIPLLISRFLEEFYGPGRNRSIEEEAMSILMEYDYPGNIRELRAILLSAVNLAQGKSISKKTLPDHLKKHLPKKKVKVFTGSESIVSLARMEKAHIVRAHEHTGRNKSQTAKLLGIGLNTLRRKLELYGED